MIKVENCTHEYYTDVSCQLMSNPPKYRRTCVNCNNITFITCAEFNAKYKEFDTPRQIMPIISLALHDAIMRLDGEIWASGFGWETQGDWWLFGEDEKIERPAYKHPEILKKLHVDVGRAQTLLGLDAIVEQAEQLIDELERLK